MSKSKQNTDAIEIADSIAQKFENSGNLDDLAEREEKFLFDNISVFLDGFGPNIRQGITDLYKKDKHMAKKLFLHYLDLSITLQESAENEVATCRRKRKS